MRLPARITALMAVGLAAVTLTGTAAAAPAPAATGASSGSCSDIAIPVALAPGQPADQMISAHYCQPAVAATAISILVAGNTYDSEYWLGPGGQYDYPAFAMSTGQAVLDFDRLGTGGSSKPPGTDLTMNSDAYVLHQLITWARSAGYRQVNVIGHSMGSYTAAREAAEWPADPSRLVLTGYSKSVSLLTAATALLTVSADFYPAILDPAFAGSGLDPSYLTTRPGTRHSLFYGPDADPAVIAWDEQHKSVGTTTELTTVTTDAEAPAALSVTNQVTAPVLVVLGANDALVCAGQPACSPAQQIQQAELAFFTNASSLHVVVIPRTGHSLNLDDTASETDQTIAGWLASTPAQ